MIITPRPTPEQPWYCTRSASWNINGVRVYQNGTVRLANGLVILPDGTVKPVDPPSKPTMSLAEMKALLTTNERKSDV